MVGLRVQSSLVVFVKLWQQTQTLIHLSTTIRLLKPHCILEVLSHFYKRLLLSFCGFLEILVLVNRSSLINFVCRSVFFHQGTCYQVTMKRHSHIIKPYLVKSLCCHACPRDCVLFRDTHNFKFSTLVKCPKCGSDRYLSRNITRKHFLYLPLGPRFGHLFGTASLAQVVQLFGTNEKYRTQLQPDIMDDIQQSHLWNTFRSSARVRTIFL